MNDKEYIEKQLKWHKKVTVYDPTNIPMDIYKQPCMILDKGYTLRFDMDCIDLWEYCRDLCLQRTCPTTTNNNE